MKPHKSRVPLGLTFDGAGGISCRYFFDRFGIPLRKKFTAPWVHYGWCEWTINIILN